MRAQLEKSDEEWRGELTHEQYKVTRSKGTEARFLSFRRGSASEAMFDSARTCVDSVSVCTESVVKLCRPA